MIYVFGDYELDLSRRELRREGRPAHLGRRPFDVLAYLIHNRHRAVSANELIAAIWRVQAVSDSIVPTVIRTIRLALGDSSTRQVMIRTIPHQGYRFVATIEVHPGSPDPIRSATAFVGRHEELSAVQRAFEVALSGQTSMTILVGEPGIGKTRLIEEAARSVTARGAEVLTGRCREDDGAPAFWPWTQVLRAYIAQRTPELVKTELERYAPVLAQMFPELRQLWPGALPAPSPLPSRQERFRLFETVARFLTSLASRVPLLVVLDDLHRADESSLLLLEFLTCEVRQARILFLGAYRDTESSSEVIGTSTIARITRAASANTVFLSGFSRDDVRSFIDLNCRETEATDELVASLHLRSGGNPFLLTQLVALLARGGKTDDLRPDAPLALPMGIRQAVLLHVASLPADTRALLRTAATIGREVDVEVLAGAIEESSADVIRRLEPAVQARLITPCLGLPQRIVFRHVLLRDALHDDTPFEQRLTMHSRIATVMAQRYATDIGPRAAEIAHHCFHAGRFAEAVDFSLTAARWATDRLAHEDSPEHYRAALAALSADSDAPPHRRAEILLALGESEMRLGDRPRARRSLRDAASVARAVNRSDLFARAALALSPAFFALEMAVTDHSLIAMLEEALSRLAPAHVALRAQILARLALALNWADAGERITRLRTEALQMAEQAGDDATVAYVMGVRHATLWGPENAEERLRTATAVLSSPVAQADPELALVYRLFEITDLIELGAMDAAEESIRAFEQIAEHHDLPTARWYLSLHRTLLSHIHGDLDATERHAREFLEKGQEVGDRNATLSFTCHLAMLRAEQGRVTEVEGAMHEMIAEFPALAFAWRSGAANVFGENRLRQQAQAEFSRVSANNFADIPRNAMWLITLVFASVASYLLEDDQRSEILYSLLEPYADRVAIIGYSVACLGSVARALGILAAALGSWDRAEAHFEHALAVNARLRSPLWIAHTEHYYARMLAVRAGANDRARAVELASRAFTLASAHALENLKTNVRLFLDELSTGARIRFSLLP